jgi:hypothetical protein
MDPFENELPGALATIADGGREAHDRVLSNTLRARRKRTSYAAVLVGAVAAIASVATLNVTGVLGGDAGDSGPVAAPGQAQPQTDETQRLNGLDVKAPGEPCDGATMGTAEELVTKAGTQVWIPAAAQEETTKAWLCGSTLVIMVGDVQVSYEAGYKEVDAEKFLSMQLESSPAATVQSLLGRPALVAPAFEGATNNQVMLIVEDTMIRMLATKDVPIADLVNVAKSIDLERPSN